MAQHWKRSALNRFAATDIRLRRRALSDPGSFRGVVGPVVAGDVALELRLGEQDGSGPVGGEEGRVGVGG